MIRRLPSLNALRAFEAAARLGRMTGAASELHVTHGAVSRQIRGLEDVLGVRLFEGPKNRLRLTEAGAALLPELTASFDRMERAVRAISDAEAGPLDVSCLGTFTMRWLIPRLYRFQDRHPAIEVRLTADDLPVEFARQSFEVAIRVGRPPWPADALVTTLFTEDVGPVLSPQIVKGAEPAAPADLIDFGLLHTRTRLNAWADWAAGAGWSADGFPGRTFEHFYFMLEAATAGLGVAIAPRRLVVDDLAAGRLVAPFGFVPSGQSYVALRRNRKNKAAALFVAWLAEEAGRP